MNTVSSPTGPQVLHIITRLDAGGTTDIILTCLDRLRNSDFRTALIYGRTQDPQGDIQERLTASGVPLFPVPRLVRNPSPIDDGIALMNIIGIIRRGTYDLIHTHTSKAGVLGRLAARMCRVPVVHTPHGHIFYGYFGRVPTALYVRIERLMARWTDRIISLTDNETRDSLEHGIGRPEQYVTIPSGVSLLNYREISCLAGTEFRRLIHAPDEAMILTSIGRLTPVKGFDILLKGFAKADFGNRSVVLAVIGDGEQRSELEALAVRLGIRDRVRFVGALNDIRGALKASAGCVLASRNEGLGRVIIEAMAARVPVIATAVGGVPSLVKDGHTGLLVPGEQPEALAGAMQRLIADGDLRSRLSAEAEKFVCPDYDENVMLSRLSALYREVIQGQTRQ